MPKFFYLTKIFFSENSSLSHTFHQTPLRHAVAMTAQPFANRFARGNSYLTHDCSCRHHCDATGAAAMRNRAHSHVLQTSSLRLFRCNRKAIEPRDSDGYRSATFHGNEERTVAITTQPQHSQLMTSQQLTTSHHRVTSANSRFRSLAIGRHILMASHDLRGSHLSNDDALRNRLAHV